MHTRVLLCRVPRLLLWDVLEEMLDSCPDIETAERDYYRGTTAVDLRLLKLHIRRLKDQAFGALRNEEEKDGTRSEGSRTYARR